MDQFGFDINLDPVEQLASVDKPDATFVLNGIQNELQLATAAADDIDADLAVSIAGCLQDNMECDTECQRCIGGVLDRNLTVNSGVLDKTKAAIDRAIQNELSDAIGVATSLGSPITDFVVVNGTPITTNGIPNDLTQAPPTIINTVICPEGTFPSTTPQGTVECTTSTPTVTVTPTSGTGTGSPDGTTSNGVPVVPSPLPGQVTPPHTDVPPTTPPTVSPPTITQPPAQPPNVPPVVQPPQQPPPFSQPPTALPNDARYFCINNQLWGEGAARQAFPEIGNQPVNESFNLSTGEGNGLLALSSLPHGWSTNGSWGPAGHVDHAPFPDEIPCYVTNTVPTTPPVTTVTTNQLPKAIHPFCDPDNLVRPDVGVRARKPSSATHTSQLVTLGSDLETLTNQPTGIDALDALIKIVSSPIIAAGYTIDHFAEAARSTISTAADAFTTGFGSFIGAISSIAGPMINSSECNDDDFNKLAAANFLPSFLQFFGGCIPTQVTIPNVYSMNYICPVLIPSGADMNSLRSMGLITDSQWRIGVRANNLCPEWQELIVDSQRQIPTPDQLSIAWRRGIIDDDAFDYYMKRNRVLREEDANVFFKLTEFVPGPSDLVRFMVRDAFDEQVATDLQLDKDFDKKFSGKAKDWATDQGMTEDQFKFFWRSHWQIPSYTQLTEALHRIREDTPLPGSNATAKAVTVEQVRRAIEINDMSPEWVDRLIAISYRVLGRIDLRRAYEIGKIDEKELLAGYLNQGYAQKDAEVQRDFTVEDSLPKRAKKAGFASSQEVIGWYRDQLITRDQAETLLYQAGISGEKIDRWLDTAGLRTTVANRKQALAALKKRWMTGEFNVGEATEQLNRIGIDPVVIGDLLFQWSILRDAKYKAPTVGMLCDWWGRGLIDMDEFQRRVTNLGYSLIDASRIIATCRGKRTEALEKESEKLAKEAESKERRRLSDLRRAASDQKRLEKEIAAAIKAAAPCKPPPKPTCPVS